ncbi:MAG: peptide deformylase [Cardiobacteriales bacterium]|nr:MAG: peptide deformylase [Cardiobacteriales bacterium]
MSIYSILIHPDKRLRTIAKPVLNFDDELKTITENMFATMYDANGIGLAATQVNIHRRIVVMDVPLESNGENESNTHQKLVLINPEVLKHSEETAIYQEGCLSIPEQYAEVTRPAHITYRYQDISGQWHENDTGGLLAVCIQHEIDHLNGVLFIDHLSRLKRQILEKKLQKLLKIKRAHD